MRNSSLALTLALLLPACAHVPGESPLSGFDLLIPHQKIHKLEAPTFAQPGEQYFSLGAGRKIRVRTNEVETPVKALAETQHRLALLQQYLELQSDPYSGISQTASHCSIEKAPVGTSLLARVHLRVSPSFAIQCHGKAELIEERQYFYCSGKKKLFEISLFAESEKAILSSATIASCD
jgi:hypothetical protein